MREVVEEGERRLGGGPGAMEGGELPWGGRPCSFNGLLCLSNKLAERFLASSHIHMLYLSSAHLKACREAKKLVVMRGHLVVG